MSVTIPDFWRLLGESRLLSAAQVQRLVKDFDEENHAAPLTPKMAALWLMEHRAISRYQATVLLAGRAGPFFFGEYKVYERIEKGRLAGCYRAVHNATKHPVLLRFLTGAVQSDPALWAATKASALAAAKVDSPYVQCVFDAVDLQKIKFVVSEDVRGVPLDEKIAKGQLVAAEACRIARLVALGLMQIHEQGRAHGDVRLASMVLESAPNEPNVKLLFDGHQSAGPIDFSQQPAGGRLELIADYLAPELRTPGSQPDAATDIYALGCTLYAKLTGNLPFAGGTVEQKLARHLSEPIRPLEELGVPGPLAAVAARMLAKNRAERFSSAKIVAEQLAAFVELAALRIAPPGPAPTLAAFEQRKGSGFRVQGSEVSSQKSGERGQEKGDNRGKDVVNVAAPLVAISVQAKERPSAATQMMRRKKEQQKKNLMIAVGLAGLVLVMGIGGAAALFVSGRSQSQTAATGSGGQVNPIAQSGASSSKAEANAEKVASTGGEAAGDRSVSLSSGSGAANGGTTPAGISGQQVVPDDGRMLWASPTAGQPVSFRCIPPAGEVFIIFRPAEMLASEEGRRVIAALGPMVEGQRKAWEAASGFGLEEIEQLHITLHDNDGEFPRTSFVVKTKEAVAAEQLLAKWGSPGALKEGAEAFYKGPRWAYYIGRSPEDDRTFAMGEARDIKEVAAVAGAPPAVFREIERLRRTTDAQRHFTVLFYPPFLASEEGEPLFAGERSNLRQPLAWLLGDDVPAGSVSGHFGDEFFLEMRMRGSLGQEPRELIFELRERLNKVPAAVEDYFVTLDPPIYWKKLAYRYPGMIRAVHNQLRLGVENDTAVVNCYLPPTAAHNLVLGGELLVATAPGQATESVAKVASTGPKTLAEALQLKTSYSFAQQSLEFAMRDLAEDVQGNLKGAPFEFAIKIIGDDLKLDGITRNQSIRDFNQENRTVADILTALVRKANPVTTVQDPSETDQKLVWLIGPDPDSPAKQIVMITTRNAANTKKYTLPPQFVAEKK